MKRILFLLISALILTNCKPIYKKMNIDKALYEKLPDGVYAKMETSKGDMIIQFFDKEAPVTKGKVSFRWQTLDLIPMVLSSSSQKWLRLGWMEDTLFSEK